MKTKFQFGGQTFASAVARRLQVSRCLTECPSFVSPWWSWDVHSTSDGYKSQGSPLSKGWSKRNNSSENVLALSHAVRANITISGYPLFTIFQYVAYNCLISKQQRSWRPNTVFFFVDEQWDFQINSKTEFHQIYNDSLYGLRCHFVLLLAQHSSYIFPGEVHFWGSKCPRVEAWGKYYNFRFLMRETKSSLHCPEVSCLE